MELGVYEHEYGGSVDLIGIAIWGEEGESKIAVYRTMDDRRLLIAIPAKEFAKHFTLVSSNTAGPLP